MKWNGKSDVQSSPRVLDLRTTLNIMQKQKSNSNKNAPQKVSKRKEKAELMVENTFRVGKCATDFAASLADPFSGPTEACLPVTPSISSRKVRTFVRGQLVTGTNGYGFLTAQPLASNDGNLISGSVGTAACYSSSAAFAGFGIPVLNTGVTGVVAYNHNGDYSASQFSAQLAQVRLVSMGMRIRWAGTEFSRGGRIILYEDPEHADWSQTGISLSQLLANEKSREFKVSEDWTTLCHSGPVMPSEYDFAPTPFGPFGASSTPAHYLLALVQAANSSGLDFEVYWNWEISGRNVRGKSRSDADDLGFTTVSSAIRNVKDGQLDSSHPLVASKNANKAVALKKIVDVYAAKNASGWITKTRDFGRAALPYLKQAGEALPYLEAFL